MEKKANMKCNQIKCIFNENGQCEPVDQEDYEVAEPNNEECPSKFE